MKDEYRVLKPYLLLWSTQSLSALGSAMTNFALVIWLYEKSGSAAFFSPIPPGKVKSDCHHPRFML